MRYSFVTIEGCIGAGKTTLASMISADLNGRLLLEQFEDNPLLPQFYADPQRYAFSLELYFMVERFQQLKSLLSESDIFKSFTVTDFLFQKSLIFASNNLHDQEARLYRMLFDILYPSLPVPHLILYLYSPAERLLENIRKRGRPYEQNISATYLQNIQGAYLDYLKHYANTRVIILDMTGLDFLANKSDYQKIKDILADEHPPGISYL